MLVPDVRTLTHIIGTVGLIALDCHECIIPKRCRRLSTTSNVNSHGNLTQRERLSDILTDVNVIKILLRLTAVIPLQHKCTHAYVQGRHQCQEDNANV